MNSSCCRRFKMDCKLGCFCVLIPSSLLYCDTNTLIPNCDLTLHSEMREKHHGTQPFFVISQFGECLAKDLNQFLQRGKDAIVQVFLAQFLPQMFDGIDLWTVSGLKDQA